MEQQGNQRDRKIIEYLILTMAIVSFISYLTLFLLEPHIRESLINIDLFISLVLFSVFLFRKRIPFKGKTSILISIGVYVAIHSLINGGSTRAAIPIMASYIALAFLYLPPRQSKIIALTSLLILLLYGLAVEQNIMKPNQALLSSTSSFSYWLYLTLMMTINVIIVGSAILSMKKKQKESIQLLREKAFMDPLTGIMNYEGIKEHIQIKLNKGQCHQACFILIDIKNFRVINSLYGIDFGDKVLKVVGNSLNANKDTHLKTARLSDDEFCIWAEESNRAEIEEIEKQYFSGITKGLSAIDRSVSLLFYRSMSLYPDHGEDFDTLFSHAGLALKEAKHHQIFSIVQYNPQQERERAYENRLTTEIARSIEKNEFVMHYQIQHDVKSNKPRGIEALARWQTDRIRSLSPGEFLPVMAKSNLMIPFTKYVIEKVFADYGEIVRTLGPEITVSINIPPCFFLSSSFVQDIESLLQKFQPDPRRIIFEITEDIFIENMDTINEIIDRIGSLGIQIALDDFGKGYSSLSYLRSIKIDELKIDKSFIDDIAVNSKSFELFKVICNIADVYDFRVVAEGVETAEQVNQIQSTGCAVIQGYFYSRPMALSELSSSIKKT